MKKLLNILFIMFFAFTLVSCGGGGQTGGNNGGNGEKIEVQFWHSHGQEVQQVVDEMITSFEAKYPNVNVVQLSEGSYDNLLDKVKKFILGSEEGALPAIVQTYPDHVTAYLHSNSVVDLNEYIYDEEVGFDAQGFDPSILVDSFYQEGSVYGTDAIYNLPFNKSTEVVFYNQTVFAKYDWFVNVLGYEPEEVYANIENYEEVKYDANGYVSNEEKRVISDDFIWNPTWQDFEKIGEAFKATPEFKAKVEDNLAPAAFGYDSQSNLFITLTQQLAALDENQAYGAKGEKAYTRFDENGNGVFSFLDENNPYAKEAMEYYKKQVDEKHFITSGLLSNNYCSTAFKDQQVIITCGSTQGASYNDAEAFKVGVATYPQWEDTPEDKYQVIQQGANLTLLEQVDKEVEKYAWLFMLHMLSEENSIKFSCGTAYFPVRTDAYNSQKYQDRILGITRNDKGNPALDKDGNIVYNPSLVAKAAKVGWTQRNWFYTNVTFLGTDISRKEAESLVSAVMLGTSINQAFADAKNNLKSYIR